MATSGWCITNQHGVNCKYGPCTCGCHQMSAKDQLAGKAPPAKEKRVKEEAG